MPQMSYDNIEILQKLKNSSITRTELNFLIQKCYGFAISFLNAKFKSNLSFISNDKSSLEDIAMNSIVPLFVKNSDGQIGIKRSLSKWKNNLDSPSDAEYFLSRIVWRRVDQTVTKTIKEKDPIFEKILKTLNFCISNNNFRKIRYFGTVVVLENSESEVTGQIIDQTNFDYIPEVIFSAKQTELFNKIFDYLKNDGTFYPAIPLNLLVNRVKNFHANVEIESSERILDTGNDITLREIVDEGLADVKQKIEVYYVSKNKIGIDDADMIYAAFDNISKDLLNGGMQGSLYNYLKDYKPTLTREMFYSKYHHVMNYLLSRLKSNIAENIDL